MKNKKVLVILFAFVLTFLSGTGAVLAASCGDFDASKCLQSGYGKDLNCLWDSGVDDCLSKNEKCKKYSKTGCSTVSSRCLMDGDSCKAKNEKCRKYDNDLACSGSTSKCIMINNKCEGKTECKKQYDKSKCNDGMLSCLFVEGKCQQQHKIKCKGLSKPNCEAAESLGCTFTAGACIQGEAGDTGDDTDCRGYDDNASGCKGTGKSCYFTDSGKCKSFGDCGDLEKVQCKDPYKCVVDSTSNECRDPVVAEESDKECAPIKVKDDCAIKKTCDWYEPENVCAAKKGFMGIGTGKNKEKRRLCTEAINALNTPNLTAGDQEMYEDQQNTYCSESSYVESYQGPVFGGPGLKAGAQMAGSYLDASISKERSLPKLAAAWTRFLLQLSAVLAVIAFITAGIFYVTDFGDGTRVESAKKIIMWTTVGILLILGSYAIVNTLMKARFGDTDRGAISFEIVSQLKV